MPFLRSLKGMLFYGVAFQHILKEKFFLSFCRERQSDGNLSSERKQTLTVESAASEAAFHMVSLG